MSASCPFIVANMGNMAESPQIQALVAALLRSGEAQVTYQVRAASGLAQTLRGEFGEREAAQLAAQLVVQTSGVSRSDVVQRIFNRGQLLAETTTDTYAGRHHIDRAAGTVDGRPAGAMARIADPSARDGWRRLYAPSYREVYTAALTAMAAEPALTSAEISLIERRGDDWGLAPARHGVTSLTRRGGSIVPSGGADSGAGDDFFASEEELADALMAMVPGAEAAIDLRSAPARRRVAAA